MDYGRYHYPMGWPTGTASSTKDQMENIQKNTCMCFDLLFYSVLMVFPSRKFRSLRSRYMNKCCFYAVKPVFSEQKILDFALSINGENTLIT